MDVPGALVAMAEDLRLGLPLLLLMAGTLIALFGWPRRDPMRAGLERPPRDPERDPYSVTYLSLERGAYASVLREAYERLDRALRARTGVALADIPWRRSVARRRHIPDPKGLERCRQTLDRLELWSLQLELGSLVRLDFWRGRARSRRHLFARIDPALGRVEHYLSLLEQAS